MTELGTLQSLDPREVWKNEAADFTPWLSQNLDSLGKAIGVDMELISIEEGVGGFSLDIYARDPNTGHFVAIENQLEQTDHSHLGQLLTYASGVDAKIIIWVSTQVRDEHRKAIDWLNENTSEEIAFFAVQLELLRIGSSLPAPNFKVIASPNGWVKQRQSLNIASEKQKMYFNFFSDLLLRVKKEMPNLTNATKVGYDNWFNYKTGRTGFVYSLSFKVGNRFGCEVYIDTGDKENNEMVFDKLLEQKEGIEEKLGNLEWQRLDNRRACRILRWVDVPNYQEETIENLKQWALKSLKEFKDTFDQRLKSL